MFFVQTPNEIADLRTEERAPSAALLWRDHMEVEAARAKGCRNFEPNETCAEHDNPSLGRNAF